MELEPTINRAFSLVVQEMDKQKNLKNSPTVSNPAIFVVAYY